MRRPPSNGNETLLARLAASARGSFQEGDFEELRKRFEELETFRGLLDHSNDAIFLVELPSGRIADSNVSACRQLGYDCAELGEKTVFDITDPAGAARIRAFAAEKTARPRGEGLLLLTRLLPSDGSTLPVELGTHLATFGGRDYLVAVARDVSDRQRAEEVCRDLESNYRAIFNAANDGIFIHDLATGAILDVNEKVLEMYGYSREEALSLDVEALSAGEPPYTQREVVRWIGKAAHGEPQLFEWKARHKTGRPFWVEVNLKRAVIGGTDRLLAVVRDITERRRAEAGLRKERDLNTSLVQSSPAFFVTLDVGGRIRMMNETMLQGLGYGLEDVVGRSYLDLVPQEEGGELLEGFADMARRDGVTRTEHHVLTRDGRRRLVEWHVRPVLRDDGRLDFLFGVGIDITERRTLEEQLRHTQKMEAVGTLAGGLAHEFNNLMTVIMGYSDLLTSGLKPNDPLLKKAEEVRKAGKQTATLTRQLLAFSSRQFLQMEVLNLNDVVDELGLMLRRLIGEDIELATELDPSLGSVKADKGQIEQILMNIVVNARDAMSDGGRITIETRCVALDEREARQHEQATAGPWVVLSVVDHGKGMDRQTQAQIFDPFFTTKSPGKRTGLGLSTVYGIVKQTGGFIRVESEPDAGTTFRVYLPQVEGPPPAPREEAEGEPPRGRSETILLVEDEDTVRTVMRESLQRSGYQVLEARNAGEALLICEQHTGLIHLMLTDLVMPRMSGSELAERLEPWHPEMKVLYVSGYTNHSIVHDGLTNPNKAFLEKPFTPTELARKVRQVLDPGRVPVDA